MITMPLAIQKSALSKMTSEQLERLVLHMEEDTLMTAHNPEFVERTKSIVSEILEERKETG